MTETSAGQQEHVALPAPSTDRSRFIGFDGMRGYLALCVILVHTWALLAPRVILATNAQLLGEAIVVFFALSGFLIYLPFARRIIDGREMPSIRDYARGRVLRIYPAYIVAFLIADLAIGAVFLTGAVESINTDSDAGSGRITDPLRILLNLTLLHNYLPSQLQTGLNVSWTLTVEAAFYLVLPFLAFAASRLRRSHPTWNPYLLAGAPGVVLIVVGALGRATVLILSGALHLSLNDSEWGPTGVAVLARSILAWSDNFGFGMLAVVVYIAVSRGVVTRIAGMRPRTAAVVLFAATMLVTMADILLAPRLIPFFFAAAAASFLLILALPTRTGTGSRFSRAIDWLPMRYIGIISLSTYLWHYPVLLVLTRWHLMLPGTVPGAIADFLIVSVITIVISSASYWLIERPAQKWAASRAKRVR